MNYLLKAATITSIIGLSTFTMVESALAERRVHLDVHRYCQRVFRQGHVWEGRQYTADGWHRYNERNNEHECGFKYRLIGETTNSGSVSGDLKPEGVGVGIEVERETTRTDLGRIRENYESVWLNKACREQTNNPNASAEQEGDVVWCILP